MSKRGKGKTSQKVHVLGISLVSFVVCVCVYLNVKQIPVSSRASTVLNVPTVTIRNSDFLNDLDDLNFSIHSLEPTNITITTTTEVKHVKGEENKTNSPDISIFTTGIPNTTEKLYKMAGLFTRQQPIVPPEKGTKEYKVPEPVANVRPAFVRIYEENDVYDKYGLWKVGGNTCEVDTLMKVILKSLVDQNDEDKEIIWPPTLWPLTLSTHQISITGNQTLMNPKDD